MPNEISQEELPKRVLALPDQQKLRIAVNDTLGVEPESAA
jgi:hypothetical protein